MDHRKGINFLKQILFVFFISLAACVKNFESALPESGVATSTTTTSTSTTTTTMALTVTSPSFSGGGSMAVGFSDTRLTQCAGANNFPGLSWSAGPTSTASYTIIVEDIDGGNWVHLNLSNISSASTSIATLAATANVVSFPSGIAGSNSWINVGGESRTSGWAGPCPPSGTHRYVFYVYAMSATHSAINDMTHSTFETTYGSQIVGKGTITGNYP